MKDLTYKQLEAKIRNGKCQLVCDLMGSYKNIAQVINANGKIVSYYLTGTISTFFTK